MMSEWKAGDKVLFDGGVEQPVFAGLFWVSGFGLGHYFDRDGLVTWMDCAAAQVRSIEEGVTLRVVDSMYPSQREPMPADQMSRDQAMAAWEKGDRLEQVAVRLAWLDYEDVRGKVLMVRSAVVSHDDDVMARDFSAPVAVLVDYEPICAWNIQHDSGGSIDPQWMGRAVLPLAEGSISYLECAACYNYQSREIERSEYTVCEYPALSDRLAIVLGSRLGVDGYADLKVSDVVQCLEAGGIMGEVAQAWGVGRGLPGLTLDTLRRSVYWPAPKRGEDRLASAREWMEEKRRDGWTQDDFIAHLLTMIGH